MENLKNVTDHFKGRVFSIGSAIGEGQISHPVKVLQSYDFLCLCEVKKAYVSGQFREHLIGKIFLKGDGEEGFIPSTIDYETQPNMPPRYAAPESVVRARYEKMVDAAKLAFFEAEVRESRQAREAKEREASDIH